MVVYPGFEVSSARFGHRVQVHTTSAQAWGRWPVATAANRRTIAEAGQLAPPRAGRGTVVGAFCTVYAGVAIGRECQVGDGAVIREGTTIGDRCVIGTNVDLQYDVTLADEVKILNGAHIAGGTVIGAGSFIGPGVWTANDRRIDMQDYQDRGTRQAPVIGSKVFVGAHATILPGVTIGDGATIAAGAVVVRDVPAGTTIKAPGVVGYATGGRVGGHAAGNEAPERWATGGRVLLVENPTPNRGRVWKKIFGDD